MGSWDTVQYPQGSTNYTGLGLVYTVKAISADYTVLDSDIVVLGTTGAGNITATLPTAVGRTGKVYKFKKVDAGAGDLIIDGAGTETIEGAATKVLANQYDSTTIVSDGANWLILD